MTTLVRFKLALRETMDRFKQAEGELRFEDHQSLDHIEKLIQAATSASVLRRQLIHYLTRQVSHKFLYILRNDLKKTLLELLESHEYTLATLLIEENGELQHQLLSIQKAMSHHYPELESHTQQLQLEKHQLAQKLKQAEEKTQLLEVTVEELKSELQTMEFEQRDLLNRQTVVKQQVATLLHENESLREQSRFDQREIELLRQAVQRLCEEKQEVSHTSTSTHVNSRPSPQNLPA